MQHMQTNTTKNVAFITLGCAKNEVDSDRMRALIDADTQLEVIDDPALPVVCNLNIGHAAPRCILPFGVNARVDVAAQKITFA